MTELTGFDSPVENEGLHRLPCRIDYDGPARVSTFFRPTAAASESGTTVGTGTGTMGDDHHAGGEGGLQWEATFRGRRLVGVSTALPQHVTGLVVSREFGGVVEDPETGEETEVERIHASRRFDRLVHWHHEQVPRKAGSEAGAAAVERWLEWMRVARVLHGDDDDDDQAAGS